MARSRSPFNRPQRLLLVALALCAAGCREEAPGDGGGTAPPAARTAAVTSPIGAHALHGRDTPIHRALTCDQCHVCPAPAPVWGALATLGGAAPAWDPATGTCSGVYCHGAKLDAPPAAAPEWTTVEPDYTAPAAQICSSCHAYPPPRPHPQRVAGCHGCHTATVRPDGTVDLDGGHHIDGHVDFAAASGTGCAGCHEFPPAEGAHAAHVGLTGAAASADYGELSILQDLYPDASPALAPHVYAFGCGNCHPLDAAKHMDGALQVELRDPAAPAGSLKARAAPTAAWDPATGTCSGTYCHSSGQLQPTHATTPSWRAPAPLGCDGCHGNPPRYPSSGPGLAGANGHLALASNGREWGHFLGEAGPRHGAYHGGATAGRDAAPITCQTCHFETTDPSSTGASGFYWLDTTGAYQLPGGDPARLTGAKYLQLDCTRCHAEGGRAPARGGRVLPLRHVNGVRDVAFDPRTSPPDAGWLPAAPNRPAQPYWLAGANPRQWPAGGVTWTGTTVSFSLAGASWDAPTKTCSNVACHGMRPATWGAPYRCADCHVIH